MTYEVHITCNLNDAKTAQIIADKFEWETSQIERDIILGQNSYFYLTAHFKTKHSAFSSLNMCVAALKDYKIEVVRQKIELIIYDTKLNKD